MPYADPDRRREFNRAYQTTDEFRRYRRQRVRYLHDLNGTIPGYRKPREPQRNAHLKHMYGITLAEFSMLCELQGWCCRACGDELGTGWRVHLDHDHVTGKNRGVLCHPCNLAVGYLKDDPVRANKLVRYLEQHS